MVEFPYMVLIIAIFGLIIGSLLNAIIYRLKSGDKIVFSRSKCVHCHKKLSAWDLIPIFSFIFLKGKCRYCHKAISWQYPLVELATAVIFVLGYFKYLYPNHPIAQSPNYLTFLVFSCFLIIIFVYDLKHNLILDKVSLPALIIAFIANFLFGFTIWNLALAGIIVAGFFLFQFVISNGKWIGGGDIRLGLVMGAMLGWPNVLAALLLAYIIGAAVGLILIGFKKKQLNSHLPFGTFLTLATLIILLFGEEIVEWYLTILHFL